LTAKNFRKNAEKFLYFNLTKKIYLVEKQIYLFFWQKGVIIAKDYEISKTA